MPTATAVRTPIARPRSKVSPSTVTPPQAGRTYGDAPRVPESDKVREDRLRRRMGAARSRLDATCTDQAEALGHASHVSIVHRRAGRSPEAETAIEIDRLERRGIDTEPIFAALRVIQLAARFESLTDHEVLSRLLAGIADEHALEADENRATHEFLVSGCFRSLAVGLAPETDLQMKLRALAIVAADRGIEYRRMS